MGKFTKIAIKVPDVNRSYTGSGHKYSAPAVIASNKATIDAISKKYGKVINRWGTEFEIDDSIIICFIAAESMGVNAPTNAFGATGLTQMTAPTVWEIITKWEKITGQKLPRNAANFIYGIVPAARNFDANTPPTPAILSQITAALQSNTEFNILTGTANIRWLLEALKDGSTSNINKVMVSYNAGYYATRNKMKGAVTTEALIGNKAFSLESRSYLLKMLGVNGFLDLYWEGK